jgi:hypothetical protein
MTITDDSKSGSSSRWECAVQAAAIHSIPNVAGKLADLSDLESGGGQAFSGNEITKEPQTAGPGAKFREPFRVVGGRFEVDAPAQLGCFAAPVDPDAEFPDG